MIQVTCIPEFKLKVLVPVEIDCRVYALRRDDGKWMLNKVDLLHDEERLGASIWFDPKQGTELEITHEMKAAVKHEYLARQFEIHEPSLLAALDAKEKEEAEQGIVRSPC